MLRIVITGLGCISPLGHDVEATWQAALTGESGVGPITLFDASEHETRFAAEVKDFNPVALFGRKEARRLDRYTQFAMAAVQEALTQAKLEITDSLRDRMGVLIGSGLEESARCWLKRKSFLKKARGVSAHSWCR